MNIQMQPIDEVSLFNTYCQKTYKQEPTFTYTIDKDAYPYTTTVALSIPFNDRPPITLSGLSKALVRRDACKLFFDTYGYPPNTKPGPLAAQTILTNPTSSAPQSANDLDIIPSDATMNLIAQNLTHPMNSFEVKEILQRNSKASNKHTVLYILYYMLHHSRVNIQEKTGQPWTGAGTPYWSRPVNKAQFPPIKEDFF